MSRTGAGMSPDRRSSKSLPASTFVFLLSTANLLLYHYPLLAFGVVNIDYLSWNGVMTLITVAVIVWVTTSMMLLVLTLVSVLAVKAFAVVAVFGNALALYFIATYQVILDKSMMGNVLDTRADESLELLPVGLAAWIVLLGVAPAWLIVRTVVRSPGRFRLLVHIVGCGILLCAFIYINASTSLWIDKHSKRIGGMILPWSYLFNTARLQADRSRSDVKQKLLPDILSSTDEPSVVVLVIGETARASNFSMYGYERQTNPQLAETGAIALPDATSCSTYTTASLHCMLSHDGGRSGPYEPLPSYLQRSGVDVVWRANNWGEPRIDVETCQKAAELRAICAEVNCDHDEVLLTGLVERIRASDKEKVFVVLHTKGSHGPSYSKRYPEAFSVFTPVCESVELDKCTAEELINAYDNTILYTDHLLRLTIERLETLTDVPSLMMYVSDHGESLGEYGLYLHGTPYTLAPDVQKQIPFVIWMSPAFRESRNVEDERFTRGTVSHDNVFHSVMGALGISSGVYDESRDIFVR